MGQNLMKKNERLGGNI